MRELLTLGVIDFIISIILILLKISGVLLWSWVTFNSGNIFITPNRYNDIIYFNNDNYI